MATSAANGYAASGNHDHDIIVILSNMSSVVVLSITAKKHMIAQLHAGNSKNWARDPVNDPASASQLLGSPFRFSYGYMRCPL